jgi:hypothetical protein
MDRINCVAVREAYDESEGNTIQDKIQAYCHITIIFTISFRNYADESLRTK